MGKFFQIIWSPCIWLICEQKIVKYFINFDGGYEKGLFEHKLTLDYILLTFIHAKFSERLWECVYIDAVDPCFKNDGSRMSHSLLRYTCNNVARTLSMVPLSIKHKDKPLMTFSINDSQHYSNLPPCWVLLGWVSLYRVSLCWMSLCWGSVCWVSWLLDIPTSPVVIVLVSLSWKASQGQTL